MANQPAQTIWHNGRLKPWAEATVHVMAHGLHYGSAVFEGIRVYETPDGPMGFRLTDHVQRLMDSARIYRMPETFSFEQIMAACHEVVVANGFSSAYLRPILYRGWGSLGVVPGESVPVEAAVAAIEWGAYLGKEGLEKGVDVCISSWNRPAPNTTPAAAKASGNYLSSQLISGEARRNGYAEGIGLTVNGELSEGAGENLFVVRDGVLYTPPQSCSILAGITRHSILTMAQDLDIPVREQNLSREALYLADELFFTGTAAEVTPIASVDGIAVRCGGRGDMTRALQERFFGLFSGATEDRHRWLEPIRSKEPVQRQEKAHGIAAIAV